MSLGYESLEQRPFTLADARVVHYDIGVVSLRLDGRVLPVVCVFGAEGGALLGTVALENFLLPVDPVNQRLIPLTGKLM